MNLVNKKCIPCSGDIPALSKGDIEKLKGKISVDWKLTHGGTRLLKKVKFDNFERPMKIANAIGKLADDEWHHPELHIGYGHLDIEIWTHKINALVESDFIFAAKVDSILKEYSEYD